MLVKSWEFTQADKDFGATNGNECACEMACAMTAPTDQEIAELRRLLLAATPALWHVAAEFSQTFIRATDMTIAGIAGRTWIEREDNAALIVAMRNTLTDLLDAYEARGKEIERLRADGIEKL